VREAAQKAEKDAGIKEAALLEVPPDGWKHES
jgi:hypothetical protein